MIRRAALAGGLGLCALAGRGAAQAVPRLAVSTVPAAPARGAFVWVTVAADSSANMASVHGTIGDEPLHFERAGGARFRALAGLPLDGTATAQVEVTAVLAAGDSVPAAATFVLGRSGYPSEALTVAPGMASPDSAANVRIASEIELARAVGRRARETPRLWRGPFRAPRPGRITSGYGTARTFNGAVASRHMGTDFAGRIGAPVRAANRGVVALVGNFLLAGRVVYLDHGDGITTGYFHLSRTAVAIGDTVRTGQVIGAIGRSGRVTGPHLHWVARYGEWTLDGATLLAATKEAR